MKIRVLKGYLAHEGEMYGKGEVVDIKKKTVALSLLESDKFESAEDNPIEVPENHWKSFQMNQKKKWNYLKLMRKLR